MHGCTALVPHRRRSGASRRGTRGEGMPAAPPSCRAVLAVKLGAHLRCAGGPRPSSNSERCAAACPPTVRAIPPATVQGTAVYTFILRHPTRTARAQWLAGAMHRDLRSDLGAEAVHASRRRDLVVERDRSRGSGSRFGLLDFELGFPELGWAVLCRSFSLPGDSCMQHCFGELCTPGRQDPRVCRCLARSQVLGWGWQRLAAARNRGIALRW